MTSSSSPRIDVTKLSFTHGEQMLLQINSQLKTILNKHDWENNYLMIIRWKYQYRLYRKTILEQINNSNTRHHRRHEPKSGLWFTRSKSRSQIIHGLRETYSFIHEGHLKRGLQMSRLSFSHLSYLPKSTFQGDGSKKRGSYRSPPTYLFQESYVINSSTVQVLLASYKR